MSRVRKATGWAAICACFVAGYEGLSTTAYHDTLAQGLPTVCYGETINVSMGDKYTPEECKNMLAASLPKYNEGIDRCIHVPMSDKRRAAVVSLAYNIGVGAVCKSTFVKKLNAGDPKACDYILPFNRASGKVVRGLQRRREAERKLCIEGA